MKKIKRILWPTDFSALAEQAMETVITLARSFRAQIIIGHIVQPIPVSPPSLNFDVTRYEKEMLSSARNNLKKLAERLLQKDRKLKVKTVVRLGQPAESIAELASHYQVDLIAICTHGRTGFNHFLFGSVAERVIRTAACPVLVIRAKASS